MSVKGGMGVPPKSVTPFLTKFLSVKGGGVPPLRTKFAKKYLTSPLMPFQESEATVYSFLCNHLCFWIEKLRCMFDGDCKLFAGHFSGA